MCVGRSKNQETQHLCNTSMTRSSVGWSYFQIYPGPRFENHLINEHGIIFDLDYIINLSLFKEENDQLPALTSSKVNGDAAAAIQLKKG